MTLPRTCAGFLRDKEITGEYNIQEGFEVLGREGLTGPCMMAVAPLSLWIASKFAGQSTSVNSELIKRYGNSLKEMVSAPDFDKELLKNSGAFILSISTKASSTSLGCSKVMKPLPFLCLRWRLTLVLDSLSRASIVAR